MDNKKDQDRIVQVCGAFIGVAVVVCVTVILTAITIFICAWIWSKR